MFLKKWSEQHATWNTMPTTPMYISCRLKTFSILRWQKDKLLPLQTGEPLKHIWPMGSDNKVIVKLRHWTGYSLRKKWLCKHSYLLLSFLVSITCSPSANSTHSPPPFSQQQVSSRISSHLQPCLALTFGVSVVAYPQTLVGQTKDEPSEEPGFPAKCPNYSSQHKANLCWPSIPYQVWLVTIQQQAETFSINRCKRSKYALYQWHFS